MEMQIKGAMRQEILKKLDRMEREEERFVVIDLVPGGQLNMQSLSFWETEREAREICDLSKESAHMPIEGFRRLLHRQNTEKIEILTNEHMIQKNVDYLAEQVKFTGFGDKLGDQIKEQIARGPEKFELPHEAEFNGHKVQATLEFGKSKQSDMYFFNRYQVALTPESGGAAMNQTFYVQQKGQSLTLKEAYNLMNGRAVYKNELANKQGELYGAWLKLDFKEPDGKQGFKLQPYGEKYGFKLEEALSKQPIMELVSAADREKLINSLEKGNRVAVTFNIDGKTEKRSIEASPTSHGINMFDENQKLIKQEWKPNVKQGEAAAEKQGKRAAQKVA